MKQSLIFLEPVLQHKMWGGKRLATEFGFLLPSETVGEAWCISAHPNGIATVVSPIEYAGWGLDRLYQEVPALFGEPTTTTFPLLVKILDAAQPLSVQVHPSDAYALKHEGELGKTECWYIMDAEEDAEIIYGHRAQTRAQFEQMVADEQWDDLLVHVPVKKGDFFDVPAGTIHAIGKGVLILETQQNSDTTYRVYDYNRLEANGQPRPLHLQQSADVTLFPDVERKTQIKQIDLGEATLTEYVRNQYFTVWHLMVNGNVTLDLEAGYQLVTVLSGNGEVTVLKESVPLKAGMSFIVPVGIEQLSLSGHFTLMYSQPNE